MSAKVLTEYTGARPLFPPINTPQKYTGDKTGYFYSLLIENSEILLD